MFMDFLLGFGLIASADILHTIRVSGQPESETILNFRNRCSLPPSERAHAMSFDGDPANYISNLSRRPIPFDSPAEFLAMPPPPPRGEAIAVSP